MVAEARGGMEPDDELDAFLESTDKEFAAVTPAHLSAARRAWRRFGKGNHPDALDFGDCFA